MTVSYNLAVSSVNTAAFVKLLFRWRGSIWKSVGLELIIWTVAYYIVFIITRYFILDCNRTEYLVGLAGYLDSSLQHIPLEFMLGFFVTIIVHRWRESFRNMGWIENVAHTVAVVFRGEDSKSVLQRRTIVRHLVLSQIFTYRDISMRVRRRFPNLESIVQAGFMLEHERQEFEKVDLSYNKYWVPVNWALKIVADAEKEKKIETSPSLNNLISEIKNFRTNLAQLYNFDWVPIPIAYPQVVFLAVRVYFFICLLSRQYIIKESECVDVVRKFYIPIVTMLQFIFYVGWMKVAEVLLNPLGEDDDDFEVNYLIDKNLATGLAIVDTTYGFCPDLLPDDFMDKKFIPLYSEDSARNEGLMTGYTGSVEDYQGPLIRNLSTPTRFRRIAESLRRARRHRFRNYSVHPLDETRSRTDSSDTKDGNEDYKGNEPKSVMNGNLILSKVDEELNSIGSTILEDEQEVNIEFSDDANTSNSQKDE